MRHFLMLAALTIAAPTFAQEKVWTPAPVPSIGAAQIQPAARAGQPVSGDDSTPFSSAPAISIERNGSTSANTHNGVQTPDLSGK